MNATEWNREWGRHIVRSLLLGGVGKFFLSPGARSAPVAAALAGLPPKKIATHFDERGMAFAALGWARAKGLPAACLTTSGSAVANLHPAVIEAAYAEVPLVLLTADRPPELRGVGANQTIQQPGIFGSAVRWAADLPCPHPTAMGYASALVEQAVAAARGPWPGPVHLNLPFREPLLPDQSATCSLPDRKATPRQPQPARPARVPVDFFAAARGVVVVGGIPLCQQAGLGGILRLARRLGWPVFADPLSGLKGAGGPVLNHAGLLLGHALAPAPERALHFGGKIVCKRVAQFIAHLTGHRYLQVRPSPAILDPLCQHPATIHAQPAEFCHRVAREVPKRHNWEWLERWLAADARVTAIAAAELERAPALAEPKAARWAAALAAETGACLFLGNSMPVRDFDAFAGTAAGGVRIDGNRGASGIDGNIATIAGLALGGRRVIGLLGDLAVLHDLNSLALLRGLPVTLMVVNNGGGGIFRLLPLALPARARTRLLETPHGFRFRAAAAQFGIAYRLAHSGRGGVAFARKVRGPCLIEFPCAMGHNHQLHRRADRTVAALSDPWNP